MVKPAFYDSIFICYSPLHIYIAECISRSTDKVLLVIDQRLTVGLKSVSSNFEVLVLPIPSFSSGLFFKIFVLARYFFSPLHYTCTTLYIPNSGHHFVQTLSRRIIFQTLNYIDEGNTCLSLIRHSKLKKDSSNFILRLLLSCAGLNISPFVCDHRFSSYFVFNPSLFKQLTGYSSILPIPDYPRSFPSIDPHINTALPILFFLGSPITENGWSDYCNQEVDVLESFIESKICERDYFVLIKPHYRENPSKYARLLVKYPHIAITCSSTPSQLYANLQSLSIVFGFHSSALFGFPSDTQIVSLILMLHSQHAKVLYEGMMRLKMYYPQLSFHKFL